MSGINQQIMRTGSGDERATARANLRAEAVRSASDAELEFFQSIANEFSGTEFTMEDLIERFVKTRFNSYEEALTDKDNFSIIHVEGYPELSNEEYKMVTEIMLLHDYVPCGCFSDSKFIQDLKVNRKNKTILQWYTSLFPTEEQDNEYALEYFKELKRLRLFSPGGRAIWSELYANEEHCNKIMEKDMEKDKKYREDKIRHQRLRWRGQPLRLRGLENEPINPHEYAFSLRHEGEIFNYYGLNTPTPEENSD